jgi:ribosomal-protein-alanine N-acetyltransferase
MLQISFEPFPILRSDRLILRQITDFDVEEVFALRSNPETMKYIPRPLIKNREDVLDFIAFIDQGMDTQKMINWAITLKEEDKLIGMICLIHIQPENHRTEIGYLLHQDFHGKGIMNEAVGTLINYAFDDLQFHSLEAVIDPANSSSEKVLLKHGFVKEAHFKENAFFEGKYLDAVVYSLLKANRIDL